MLTNALQRRATPEFDARPAPRRGVLLSIDGHPAFVARGKNEPSPPSPAPRIKSRPETARQVLEISPASHAKRRVASWKGMTAEIVQATSGARTSYRYRGPMHLLVLFEQATRREGETQVGELHSSLRDMGRKLVFVPTGHEYRDSHEGRNPTRMVLFYIEPEAVPLSWSDAGSTLLPRLLFEDATLLSTAQKLATVMESSDSDNRAYLEALGFVLLHELVRLHQGSTPSKPMLRGGLAAWQQRAVTTYIEQHLAEPVSLASLAALVGLSTFHFCRAFKQSVGMPPHRYHTRQRIERAKALLAKPALSVTEIGLAVGFSETSSFTAAFRKATGLTPTAYHRSLV
jgi:AraC family transcriptional regulator